MYKFKGCQNLLQILKPILILATPKFVCTNLATCQNVHEQIWELPKLSRVLRFVVNFGNLYAYISGKLPNLYASEKVKNFNTYMQPAKFVSSN